MITTIQHGEVLELRLNRPPANALNFELLQALGAAVDTAPAKGARALVLSGAPGLFSAGLDIPALVKSDRTQISALWKSLYAALGSLARSAVPICAAVTGHAPAGGTVLAIFCDWRIAAEGEFKIGLSEVQVGLPLPPVIFHALRRLVGARHADRLAVGGMLINPKQAADAGLMDETAPPDLVVDRAIQWTEQMLSLPHGAMSYTRRHARADLRALFERDLTEQIREMEAAWWQPETQAVLQTVAARLAKRKV
jgi:enoyl-CoA hydratase/carnithine racemase